MFPTVTHTTHPDSEPSQFILPDLVNDCHYPLRKNPHCYAVSRASDQWLTDVAQLVEPEVREYLDADIGGCAAVCHPDADAFHLQVCAEFLNWAFVIDDWMECGVVDVREAHESCILALHDPINFETEQLGAKMCKSFFSRFKETAGPGCTERFIRGSELFFAAVAKHLDDRAKGNMYDLPSYIALRKDLVAMKICSALIEFAGRIDLPDEVVSHPVFQALEDAANDHVSWCNDIFSYNKEQSRGSAPWENIVSVLMHDRGLDLQGAMDYAGQMCKDAIQRFESNRVVLPSWGEEVDRQVAIHIDGLQNWMVGSLHWHLNCIRYFGKDGHAVKLDRIVKLLPKRPL
ncbi:isoprenoid synthase domain-containing protein [Suillus subalutaceus]|uniref:isoprenoid synthase domain-containing protein n=1 Tax=Suillus subalutaceus TaxID=48586 RepID=UPI001B86F726|nr:isoprenoid synthase domain-containing protein [Suillus subalutaceus]KAG1852780.1 isoprenoid synthase domain-containing protein [Suillus subalutaceus]